MGKNIVNNAEEKDSEKNTKRKNKKEAISKTKNILLNRPLSSAKEDWVGIETYVDKLNEAIESEAQVIGIISEFGMGKSSILTLYEKKYIEDKPKTKKKLYRVGQMKN